MACLRTNQRSSFDELGSGGKQMHAQICTLHGALYRMELFPCFLFQRFDQDRNILSCCGFALALNCTRSAFGFGRLVRLQTS